MMDKIKKVESLLEDYYSTEDEFVRTDIPIIIMQNYVDWMIETIKNQQAEIDTLSMAHDEMHRLIDRDKHFLIKSNIALNNKIKELEDAREADIEELGYVDERLLEAEQQNKRYREALEFYAEGKHVAYKLDETDDDLVVDYGETARKALEGEE